MNCFQKSYLWLLNTTRLADWELLPWLWIAFKNLIFDYWTQLEMDGRISRKSCELLSKILSLTIEHNVPSPSSLSSWVVNCFQKSYLWLLNTTRCTYAPYRPPLWIAFKNLIFDYWTQRCVLWYVLQEGCELLSKILSLTIEHNWLSGDNSAVQVVNCFQKSYLWLLNTTRAEEVFKIVPLWIAFKNLIFDYWTQQFGSRKACESSCELLSKILSLTIEHN